MTESVRVPGRRLGRRVPSNKVAVQFAEVWKGTLPEVPASVDYLDDFTGWQMLGNDQFGDCGPVSVANSRTLTTTVLSGAPSYPTLDDVFDLYRRSGNPNFDPATDTDDNGVDMQTMLEAVNSGGIAGVKSVAFAKVDHTDLAQVKAAIAIFGSILIGVNLETAQQGQRLWAYSQSPTWGGHAVLCGGYVNQPNPTDNTTPDIDCVTWAEVVPMTDMFWGKQVEEAWVVIWPEHFGSKEFMDHMDVQALAAAYQQLTHRPLPVPQPAPAPTPTPVPSSTVTWDELDAALAPLARHFIAHHHHGENKQMAAALMTWLKGKSQLNAGPEAGTGTFAQMFHDKLTEAYLSIREWMQEQGLLG